MTIEIKRTGHIITACISFVCILAIIHSCKLLEIERVVKIETGEVSGITVNSASITGAILDVSESGVDQYGHCWSTGANPQRNLQTKTSFGATANTGSFKSDLPDLTVNTTYYIRAYAISEGMTIYGEVVSFNTTNPALPELTTVTPSNITDYSVTCGGNISSDGGAAVTARGVCWRTSMNPTPSDNFTTDGSGTGSFTSNITGLASNTLYFIRAYATNISGTGYGNQLNFTTTSIVTWDKSIGGNQIDKARCIRQTTDGGYIVSGLSYSDDDIPGHHGNSDAYIVKLTSTGDIDWQKALGGSESEVARSVRQTTDGGYIIAGYSDSDDGDVTGNHGLNDWWIAKLTSAGDIEWQKSLGGLDDDFCYSVQQTTDGGYIAAGYTYSNDGDVSGNHGGEDYWIVKLASTGDIEWQKTYGGSEDDEAYSILQTYGGYIIAGYSHSEDGDITENKGLDDYWIVKIDTAGNIEWQNSLGGPFDDKARSIRNTLDGGYIVAGESWSNEGDVSGNHGIKDYWVVKLNSIGNIEWQKSLGGVLNDSPNDVQQTNDLGYIIAGYSESVDGDVTGNHGYDDCWIVKLSSAGELDWQKSIGGSNNETASSIQVTTDGGYIIAGSSGSEDGDVSTNNGSFDFWIVKIPGE